MMTAVPNFLAVLDEKTCRFQKSLIEVWGTVSICGTIKE